MAALRFVPDAQAAFPLYGPLARRRQGVRLSPTGARARRGAAQEVQLVGDRRSNGAPR